ncbi:MAG: sialidase family protein [Thermoanaerobaculia bacterium]
MPLASWITAVFVMYSAPGPVPRIAVGPNILVSRDGDVGHCETAVAASPRDPKVLVGTATTFTRPPDGGVMNKTYASSDGGWTWTDTTLPIEVEKGGADPQVAFDANGIAFFVGIGDYGMAVHRSEDDGKSWGKPALVKFSDHERLAIDTTTGRYAGRVYLAGEVALAAGEKTRRSAVDLWRSEDGGRTFIGPVGVGEEKGAGLAVHDLVVLSDGTLFVPMIRYPNPEQDYTTPFWEIVFSSSSDGGVSFTPPRPIAEQVFGGYGEFRKRKADGRIDMPSGPVFAGSVSRNHRYVDRLFGAWPQYGGDGVPRILLSYSSDRGATWTKPAAVDASGPAGSSQYQPSIAVSDEGIVGMAWYDTRGFPKRDRYNVYFAASLDGGETFLPSVRVSSAPSLPTGAGNLRPAPPGWKGGGDGLRLELYSPFSIWPNGGDYVGMAADSAGVFHPFWSDARSTTFQLYTARIRVERGGEEKARPKTAEAPLDGMVSLVYDPIRYLPETAEVHAPIRLRNVSKHPIYGPLHVEVMETVPQHRVQSGWATEETAPKILNASNGKTGKGAVFDYSKSLGDFEELQPGAVTEAVVWRLKIAGPAQSEVQFGLSVRGSLTPKRGSE